MGGWPVGTNGDRTLMACAAAVLLAFLACTVNALSILHEADRNGVHIARWHPWVTEYSSLLGFVAALPVAVIAFRFVRRETRLGRRVAALLLASLLFSAVHVAAMVALREGWWWLAGGDYAFPLGREWLYEYRKDALGFAIVVALLAIAHALPSRRGAAGEQPQGGAPLVSLPDGRRLVVVDLSRLRAVCGGGNYIELIFSDGRRRLLRTTLATAQSVLGGEGFRQTHRSWLVPLAHVEAMERTASGDFRLLLGGGLVAPLSRRQRSLVAEVRERLSPAPGLPFA